MYVNPTHLGVLVQCSQHVSGPGWFSVWSYSSPRSSIGCRNAAGAHAGSAAAAAGSAAAGSAAAAAACPSGATGALPSAWASGNKEAKTPPGSSGSGCTRLLRAVTGSAAACGADAASALLALTLLDAGAQEEAVRSTAAAAAPSSRTGARRDRMFPRLRSRRLSPASTPPNPRAAIGFRYRRRWSPR